MAHREGVGTVHTTIIHGRPSTAWLYVKSGGDVVTPRAKAAKGSTKHKKAGVHGRGRLPVDHLPSQARNDPWKHKDQAAHQG